MGFTSLIPTNNISSCFLHMQKLPPNNSTFTAALAISPASTEAPPVNRGRKTVDDLRESIRKEMVRGSRSPMSSMELIDTTQRLGIGYHFEEEISKSLERLVDYDMGDDLSATALRFRLLRHNGFPAHSDVFGKFIDGKSGKFKNSLTQDKWGLLSLYEASYLATKHESQLLQAMEFTTTHLTQTLNNPNNNVSDHIIISDALELPRHLRMTRLESRNYIQQYSMDLRRDSNLLDLAKSDYNSVQLLHQNELSEIKRWWKQLGLVDKLGFGRDRPLECYLWTVGIPITHIAVLS